MTYNTDGEAFRSASCLDPYISTFEAKLMEKNYKPGTIKTYRVLVRRLESLMDAAGVMPSDLTMEMAAQLVSDEERNLLETAPESFFSMAKKIARFQTLMPY